MPLIFGLLALTGSQIMLMEAPSYWVMALARVIQGISSSAVWIVGLALLQVFLIASSLSFLLICYADVTQLLSTSLGVSFEHSTWSIFSNEQPHRTIGIGNVWFISWASESV